MACGRRTIRMSMQGADRLYPEFFLTATGFDPFGFQRRYAGLTEPPTMVEVPTGLGKTEMAVLPFVFDVVRGVNRSRRLVYVLPMRSLVEQSAARVRGWLTRLSEAGFAGLPEVAVLLGGDVDDRWMGEPEKPFVLIGTQDMILSRALNRGYAISPFRWPMAFALLNNDAHWVIDEVQLQGVGTRTAAQLQGLRQKLGAFGGVSATFLSATIDRAWIDTADHPVDATAAFGLEPEDLAEPTIAQRVNATKRVEALDIAADDASALAEAIAGMHRRGTLTLIVVNRVVRAQRLFRSLRKVLSARDADVPVDLLHSRFRPLDRKAIVERALVKPDAEGPGRIVVSTQVVEAGVDIDAATLVSELAPWSSIVQRLGRCNRRGAYPDARFAWINVEETEKAAAPYDAAELSASRAALQALEGRSAASALLPRLPISLEAGATLRRVDLLDLFDTSPDLTGNEVDVGRFIREADDFTVSVFWRDEPPSGDRDRPRRDELCSAPITDVRALVANLQRVKRRESARIRSTMASEPDGLWRPAALNDVVPGALVWLRSDVGGYSATEGFDSESRAPVPRLEVAEDPNADVENDETEQHDGDGGSRLGVSVSLADHSADAGREAHALVSALVDTMPSDLGAAVTRAAIWHDAGKVHPVFQRTMIRAGVGDAGGPWAKSIGGARHERAHFRHELVSALAWLAAHDDGPTDDLIAYLVAAHHGKVRVAAWPYPGEPVTSERMILGVLDGEEVPAALLTDEERAPAFLVDLGLFNVGSVDGRPTWSDRVLALRDRDDLGPFRLAFLETLIRVADWRASRMERQAKAEVLS